MKKILLIISLLLIGVGLLFVTGVVEIVSDEQMILYQEAEQERLAKLYENAIPPVGNSEVGLADLDEIRKLIDDGEYQKALKQHIWFHQKSKASSGMGGVRVSFALTSWLELGELYPPAMEALFSLRDKNKNILLDGKGTFNVFHDLFSLNRTLENDKETVDLFLKIESDFPDQVAEYYYVVEDLLIEDKHYDVIRRHMGDPIAKYEGLRHMRELKLSFARDSVGSEKELYLRSANDRFIEGVESLLATLLAIDQGDAAQEVQRRALEYFENDRFRAALL